MRTTTWLLTALLAGGCLQSNRVGTMNDDATVTTDLAGVDPGGPIAPDAGATDPGTQPPDSGPDPEDLWFPQPDVSLPPWCCASEADCEAGQMCRYGLCLAPLQGFDCYEDSDCGPAGVCTGGSVCECGPNPCSQPTQLGVCEPLVYPPCCATDAECPDHMRCLAPVGTPEGKGVCVDKLPEGGCYANEDCDCGWSICAVVPTSWCKGGSACSCDQNCPSLAGTCEPLPPPGLCCSSDADCGPTMACANPWNNSDPTAVGLCLPLLSLGQCWTDAQCQPTEECVGAELSECADPVAAEPVATPGVCTPQQPPPGCCVEDAECSPGERCVMGSFGGVCKELPALGECWDGEDCSPLQTCEGAWLCQCGEVCLAIYTDTPGTCTGYSQGCCTGTGLCDEGFTCNEATSPPTCAPEPGEDECWTDADCAAGETCHGAALCPCNMDCDMGYEGPGVCVVYEPPCTAVEPGWVEEWCGAASVVLFDGQGCVETCPGCCHCEPFCDLLFGSMEECLSQCVPSCEVWSGGCDDAIPESPWWYFDGKTCSMNDSCIGSGPGVYSTHEACLQACQPSCVVFDGACYDVLPAQPWWYFNGSQCVEEASCSADGPAVYDSYEECALACSL